MRNIIALMFLALLVATAADACDCPEADAANGEQRSQLRPIYSTGFLPIWPLAGQYEVHFYYKPHPHPSSNLATLYEYTRICDPNNACEVSPDLTDAHKEEIKAIEDSRMEGRPGVSRVGDPSIKFNCHGATTGFSNRWVEMGVLSILGYQGYEEVHGEETLTAKKMGHGDKTKHSSYNTYMGTYTPDGRGCNGEPLGPLPTRFVEGKWGFQSSWKTPLSVVHVEYRVDASDDKYYK